jgi:hypothetical protein
MYMYQVQGRVHVPTVRSIYKRATPGTQTKCRVVRLSQSQPVNQFCMYVYDVQYWLVSYDTKFVH